MSNYLKVAGVDLASAGNIDAEGRHESKIIRDEEKYQKIVLDSTRVIGCIMLGDTRAFPRVMKLISSKRDASALKEEMLKEDFDLSSI
ncbi:MAG: hypothetical protein GX846_08765 [Deltaproteobacteria bacterium]|nr:hypothetical protein [Deltaproteobacteria bacterium]